jgi:Asp-tRNA(Asn)/Glu-tRNA(Gln) amidotransferase A subunit family amidase
MSMPAAETTERPTRRPFLTAHKDFASGADTPRAFLERCLATLDRWEPKIDAFVNLNIAGARDAANRATERWREGKPLSPIDGMPVGIKDIIETIDMPTEQGSPLFASFRGGRDAASVQALREAGAVILGKTVTTEFAATFPRETRNPWDVTRTPGGSSSGSAAAVAVGIVSAALGTQVIGSIIRPAGYCGCYGFKPTVGAVNRGGSFDGLSQSAHGAIAATLEECWVVTWEIARRAGGDAGYPGLFGPAKLPAAAQPRRVAFIETAGWSSASTGAKNAMDDGLARIKAAGVEVITRRTHKKLDAIEADIMQANQVSRAINAWEGRWPLNTYAARDAEQLSQHARDRLAQAEAMTLEEFRGLIAARDKSRALHAELADEVDACVSLTAPAAAPVGLDWTGDPACTVHTSYLGIPSVTLPVMWDDGMPLGLQVTGFTHGDAATFAAAGWVEGLFK